MSDFELSVVESLPVQPGKIQVVGEIDTEVGAGCDRPAGMFEFLLMNINWRQSA